ncbi:MAG TPA: DNA topoisomerase IB [Thermoanaerobaculia bacterium]|nr:DNA topoisomerase IB [Thermoanaerobaculia bacterium]
MSPAPLDLDVTKLERLQATGIRRIGGPSEGFAYELAAGGRVDGVHTERIAALKIPPAWRDVRISPSPRSAVQAIGRDAAGRWQYLYAPSAVRRRERKKFQRLVLFAEALPRMRAALEHDLAPDGPPRERVLACMLRILATRFLRPGSPEYETANGSYGVTTFRRRHATVDGDTVVFDFKAKGGIKQRIELADAAVAGVVRDCLKLRGKQLFQYRDDEGKPVPVRRAALNAYIRQVLGGPFSAKDFRTWAATLICAGALARRGVPASEKERARKKDIVAAVKETAESLRNTPAIARASYISPKVLESYEKGRVLDFTFDSVDELLDTPRLQRAEKALLELLKAS